MHPRSYPAALAPLACSLLAACFGDAAASERTAITDSTVPVVVRTATPVTRHLRIAVSGTVEARATADVAFQVPGKVMTVAVDEGDRVAAGQLLASLDATDYALAFEQARLASVRTGDEARRARVLRTSNGIAPNDFEKLVNADSQAEVTAAMAQKRMRDTRLVSPLSGIIGRRRVNPGETIPAGVAVFTIVDLDVVHVRVAVPESDIGAITTGATATVTVPSLGDTAFAGRVRLVGVSADPVARTFAVEIAVRNLGARLKEGMIAEASIDAPSNITALTLPGAAVVRDAEGATQVFVYASDEHRVHARRVTLGGVTGNEVEIATGVASGDMVVVGGQQRLREGMAVHPTSIAPGTTRGSQR